MLMVVMTTDTMMSKQKSAVLQQRQIHAYYIIHTIITNIDIVHACGYQKQLTNQLQ